MSKCSFCKSEESKYWMMSGNYTLCNKCAKDFKDYENQPYKDHNLFILMEVMFRRGQGEDISFEELFNEKSHLNFFTFDIIFNVGK